MGRELAARLFAKEELEQGWSVVEQRRGGQPIRMELVLPVDLQFPAQIDDTELRMWINRLERREIPRVTYLTYAEVTPKAAELRDYRAGSS